jgi:hypothetical protein
MFQDALVAKRRHLDCNTCSNVRVGSGPPGRACVVLNGTDELLVEQYGQTTPPVEEGAKQTQSLSRLLPCRLT